MHDYGISRLYLHFHPLATISLCYISTRFLGTHIYTERGHATLPLIFFYLYTFVFVLICLYSCSFCLPQPAVSRLWSRRRRAVARLGWKKRRQPASDFLFLLCNRGWYRRCQSNHTSSIPHSKHKSPARISHPSSLTQAPSRMFHLARIRNLPATDSGSFDAAHVVRCISEQLRRAR